MKAVYDGYSGRGKTAVRESAFGGASSVSFDKTRHNVNRILGFSRHRAVPKRLEVQPHAWSHPRVPRSTAETLP